MIIPHRARTGTASAAPDADRIDPAVWRLAFTVIVGALPDASIITPRVTVLRRQVRTR